MLKQSQVDFELIRLATGLVRGFGNSRGCRWGHYQEGWDGWESTARCETDHSWHRSTGSCPFSHSPAWLKEIYILDHSSILQVRFFPLKIMKIHVRARYVLFTSTAWLKLKAPREYGGWLRLVSLGWSLEQHSGITQTRVQMKRQSWSLRKSEAGPQWPTTTTWDGGMSYVYGIQ